MEKVNTTLFFAGLLSLIIMSSGTETTSAETEVLRGNNQFTTNLYKALSVKDGNIVFSPISAHAVLSMAYQGAQATTAEHFANSLKITSSKSAAEGYKQVMARLNKVADVTLLLANKIYVMEGAKLLNDFKTAVSESFMSEVQKVDFGKSAESAKAINDWVLEKTQQKIKDLISANDLNALTRLVLVNAIYFKGDWLHKFDANQTKVEPFYLNDKDTVDVQMMHTKKKFRYTESEELNAQILEMPYKNKDLSMVIILPSEKNGIKDLENKLATADLSSILKSLYSTEVVVSLPRFKIEQTIDLKEPLDELGLGEIFDENKANFRGMIELSPNENLYVSKAVQKAFIEVNEEGAEAAAATGMVMMMRCSLPIARPVIDFKADHPFIYILTEKSNLHNPLFFGRISDLTEKQ